MDEGIPQAGTRTIFDTENCMTKAMKKYDRNGSKLTQNSLNLSLFVPAVIPDAKVVISLS